ncbi:MAG: ATP-binding protein [Rhodospirillales bacterium]
MPQFGAALTGIMLSIWLGVRLQHATSELAARRLDEERMQNQHELEKREMLDRERSRIMSDMHDGVGGQLISVLSLLEHGEVPNTEVAKAIRECLDDLRLTIDSLEPTDNDLLPVLGNLRYRLDQRLKKHGIELDWEVKDVPKLACLTPRNVLHILRILQEAFTNVLKHARATKVGVETGLDAPGGHVYIRVSDNGAGFTGERAGHGLASMRRRAGIIGGSLDIQASPAGTTLNLLLPVS